MRVKALLGGHSGDDGLFQTVEATKVDSLGGVAYLRSPLVARAIPPNTSWAGVLLAAVHIFRVLLLGSRAQVGPCVVGATPVFMVNLIFRPLSGHVQPSELVRSSSRAIDNKADIPDIIDMPSAGACDCCPATVDKPREDTCLRVVVQKFAQTLRSKIGLSHEAPPVRIGQRLASVCSTARASLFSALP